MLDPKKLLDGLLGSQVPGTGGTVLDGANKAMQMAKDNPLAAGALAAVLLGTQSGRSVTGSAVKLGSLAAIGGLAYQAYKNYTNGQNPVESVSAGQDVLPAPTETGFHPANAPQGEPEFALTLIRAMISAAKADGRVDDEERARINEKLQLSGLGAEAEQFLKSELAAPVDIEALSACAKTEEQRIALYTASRLAIEPESRAERGYLDMLAGRLGLADALVDHVEATVAGAKGASGVQTVAAARVNPRW